MRTRETLRTLAFLAAFAAAFLPVGADAQPVVRAPGQAAPAAVPVVPVAVRPVLDEVRAIAGWVGRAGIAEGLPELAGAHGLLSERPARAEAAQLLLTLMVRLDGLAKLPEAFKAALTEDELKGLKAVVVEGQRLRSSRRKKRQDMLVALQELLPSKASPEDSFARLHAAFEGARAEAAAPAVHAWVGLKPQVAVAMAVVGRAPHAAAEAVGVLPLKRESPKRPAWAAHVGPALRTFWSAVGWVRQVVAHTYKWVPFLRPATRVETHGVGTEPEGLVPGFGGVESPDRIGPMLAYWLKMPLREVDAASTFGPRVLQPAELRALARSRAAPSSTVRGRTGEGSAMLGRHLLASALINRWVREGQDLSVGMLKRINRMVSTTKYEGLAGPGALRHKAKDRVGHGGWLGSPMGWFEYAKPHRVPGLIDDLLTWYQANRRTMHPVQLAALTYQQMVRIHPFMDGNGRTTRLAMDFVLQRNGLPPASFDKASFPEAVHNHSAAVIHSLTDAVLAAMRML